MRLRGSRLISAIVALVGLIGLAGCGDDEPAPAPEHRKETVEKLPKLPPGWHRFVNRRAGFAIGRAPGWRAKRDGATTLLRSPDRLVAISISADRTGEAIEFPLGDYAREAAKALPGFHHLDVRRPHRVKAHYNSQGVEAKGRSKGGVRQNLLFIAMRRDHLATYAVLIASNADRKTGFYENEALRIVRTLRGRPAG
jgi:hypothetical protein